MKNIKYGFNNWESYRKIAETLDCGANQIKEIFNIYDAIMILRIFTIMLAV